MKVHSGEGFWGNFFDSFIKFVHQFILNLNKKIFKVIKIAFFCFESKCTIYAKIWLQLDNPGWLNC